MASQPRSGESNFQKAVSENLSCFAPLKQASLGLRFGSGSVKFGYGRAGACERDTDEQAQALVEAGCCRTVIETASDARRARPRLAELIGSLKRGDVLVIWRLDRLALSLAQLSQTLNVLQAGGIALEVIDRGIKIEPMEACKVRQALATILAFECKLAAERRQSSLSLKGARTGRKPALGAADIRRARILLENPKLTVADVARRFGVQPSTLYRHIPGGRSALAEIAA